MLYFQREIVDKVLLNFQNYVYIFFHDSKYSNTNKCNL